MKHRILLLIPIVLAVALTGALAGEKVLLNLDDGVAIEGYDPVAYFEVGKAMKGDKRFQTTYGGATYRFASEEHLKRFQEHPEQYVPAYGGYCAYAASIDKLAPIDPEIFQIVDGRLMLQYSKKTYDQFNEDLAGSVAEADRNWPGLVERKGKPAGK